MSDLYPVRPCSETAAWAVVELGLTDLGDLRRTHRLVQLASALAANPACSLPQACKSWADTKGAYRFLDNEDIEPEELLNGHRRSTLSRIGEHPMILAVQDTSTYSFTGHRATRGLGPISGRFPGSDAFPTGFLVHSCLAVTPDGVPLGLLAHKLWVRPEAEGSSEDDGQLQDHNDATAVATESSCWEEILRNSTQSVPPGTKVLTVCDRGADIYDFFAVARRLHQEVLVRSAHNRELAGRKDHLWDKVKRDDPVGVMVVELPRADDRPPQTVTLQLRTARVRLHIPQSARTEDVSRVTLSAVLAQEIQSPEGREPIEWRLLTTLPVTSAEDAANCVRWYTKRWTIERYHYTLKSGCRIEELQLETVDRLHRALAVYSVVAWRLMYLTYMARTEPESPCTRFLSDSEWKALYCQTHRTKKLPTNPPGLRTAVLWIARLGGFLARKRDGNPGVKVLWQGYRRLQDMVVMWDLLRPSE
jgi:hypothetical protein